MDTTTRVSNKFTVVVTYKKVREEHNVVVVEYEDVVGIQQDVIDPYRVHLIMAPEERVVIDNDNELEPIQEHHIENLRYVERFDVVAPFTNRSDQTQTQN